MAEHYIAYTQYAGAVGELAKAARQLAELQSRIDAARGHLEDLRDKYNEESEHWAEFTGAIDLLLTGPKSI